MHQSRKEQSIERAARTLLHPDRREAGLLTAMEDQFEAAEEWAGFAMNPRRNHQGR